MFIFVEIVKVSGQVGSGLDLSCQQEGLLEIGNNFIVKATELSTDQLMKMLFDIFLSYTE